jgi:FkbM family methyltransferase
MTAVTSTPFVSYAQNGEDVVLWRALQGVSGGRYVDVGANDPVVDSVTKAFYDRGWHGMDVEPMADFARLLREQRPRDVVVQAAVTTQDGTEVVLHEVTGTGLSTLVDQHAAEVPRGHDVRDVRVPSRRLDSLVREHLSPDEPVHFCKVDVEGAEAEVLASVDLTTWRPWVLVVEATRPNSTDQTQQEWEGAVLAAGYRFCLFDGLSRYYVAEEHAELAPLLSYPACPLDGHVRSDLREAQDEAGRLRQRTGELEQELADLRGELVQLRVELVRWRGAVLERWSRAVAPSDDGARAELEALKQTVSWRATRPLRAVRSLQRRARA